MENIMFRRAVFVANKCYTCCKITFSCYYKAFFAFFYKKQMEQTTPHPTSHHVPCLQNETESNRKSP